MQNKPKIQKTFIIRHKETKELFVAMSGKSSWKAVGHAKNAFHQALGYNGGYCEEYGVKLVYSTYYDGSPKREAPKFDEQDVYEIVELKSQEIDLLGKAAELLKDCLAVEYIHEELRGSIEKFLKEIKDAE